MFFFSVTDVQIQLFSSSVGEWHKKRISIAAHTHTQTRSYTYTHSLFLSLSLTQGLSHSQPSPILPPSLFSTLPVTHTHTHTHTYNHTHTNTHSHPHRHIYTHTYTRPHTHFYTHSLFLSLYTRTVGERERTHILPLSLTNAQTHSHI